MSSPTTEELIERLREATRADLMERERKDKDVQMQLSKLSEDIRQIQDQLAQKTV